MEVRVWQSFSCNNSSSYRLVARFADAKTAAEASQELTEFFAKHAPQMDELTAQPNWDYPGPPTEAQTALGQKYGFTWTEGMMWGDGGCEGDEPTVGSQGNVLVVYHTYCGGFGGELPAFLKARGAREVEPEDDGSPSVSVLFQVPSGGEALREELTKIFESLDEDNDRIDASVPWSSRELYGKAAFFSDGKTIGFYTPIDPEDIAGLKAWLEKHGVTDASIQLCEYGDHAKFRAIGKARCLACNGALTYLSPRLHPTIEAEQLECAACGGMFEVRAFLEEK